MNNKHIRRSERICNMGRRRTFQKASGESMSTDKSDK